MKKPNPKKDRSARRPRNEYYWKTGGRQVFNAITCKKCRKEARNKRNVNAKCKSCQEKYDLLNKKTEPKDAPAKQSAT